MLNKFKLLLLGGLNRTYNLPLVRLIKTNYLLIFPKWITSVNLSLRLSLLFLFLFWLYYEIFCVSPVCPYYSGPEIPSLLNKFKSVGKTYRPTIYLFKSTLQWRFLRLYCMLELFYKSYRYKVCQGSQSFRKFKYKALAFLNRLLLRSFLFKKLFKSQPPVGLREAVEGHNGSLVVMDWYFPKWVASECEKCGQFKHEDSLNSAEDDPKFYYTVRHLEKLRGENNAAFGPDHPDYFRPQDKFDYLKMQTIESMNYPEGMREASESGDSASSPYFRDPTEASRPNFRAHASESSHIQSPSSHLSLSDIVNQQLELFEQSSEYRAEDDLDPLKGPEGPKPRIIRGVLVIVGDTNVSYRICSTRAGCYCNLRDYQPDAALCESCNADCRRDHDCADLEHPGFPTLRTLISDSLSSGFVCVHLHLNVNFGMACEAFPRATTLRAFPFSLYSDVILDLDCALNKVSDRFPNSLLVAVGFNFGSNILMEYLSMAAQGGTYKFQSDSEPDSLNAFGAPYRTLFSRTDVLDPTFYSRTTNLDAQYKSKNAENLTKSEDSYANGAEEGRNSDNASDCTQNSRASKGDLRALGRLNHEQAQSAETCSNHSNASRAYEGLYEDHFALDSNTEEFNVESKVVYPEQTPQVTLNPERIAAAVCINLNLRASGNVLYNLSKRRRGRSGLYRRFCLAAFKEQLCGLVRSVHCSRTSPKFQRDCANFRCCHYQNMLSSLGLFKRLFYRIFFIKNRIRSNLHRYSTENLIAQLHRDYRQSYRDLRSESREFINYGVLLFEKLALRTCPDFKLSVLMTMKHRFEREGQDSRVKVRHVTERPLYKYVNKKVNTNLRLGKSVLGRRPSKVGSNVHRLIDHKFSRYINHLINSIYSKNVNNIRENMRYIKVPTLLLYSLDNSMFTSKDIDIFEVIKNPNIVYYVSQTGGYSTFLSGIQPSTWFVGPVLEFLEEMSTKSKTF